MLASAIASRRMTVAPLDNGPAYTDGQTIFVDRHATTDDVRDAVAVQAALIAAGSMRRNSLLRLTQHRRIVAERYMLLEAARLAGEVDTALPPRTVRRVRRAYPGRACDSSAGSLKRAVSGAAIPAVPPWMGTLKVVRLLRAGADLGGKPGHNDPAEGDGDEAEELEPELNEDEEADAERSRILELLSSPLSSPLSDAFKKLFGMAASHTDGDGGAEMPVASRRAGAVGPKAKRSLVPRAVAAMFESAPALGASYPEWDETKNRYRADWCSVAEFDPPTPDQPEEVPAISGSMRRPLARVGIEHERHRRQPDGDALDLSALVDYVTDRQNGDGLEPLIYEQTLLTRRDLSVLILLDATGSTNEESEGRSIFEEERRLAGELTASLEELGDRVATYGFYSRGRNSVRFLRIKGFADRFDSAARRRLQAVQPSGFTRLGAALRHGTHLLHSNAAAKNMILIVVGDGLPYEEGYEDRYARADTRRAIHEAVWSGIGVVGLAIRSSVDPTIHQDIWSEVPFRVVADGDDACKHVRSLLLDALKMTRSNGRRRDLSAMGDQRELRSLMIRARKLNSYV